MSILNQMRKNPAITAGAFIFIIALIVVIVWLVNRKQPVEPGQTATGPNMEITSIQKILNPLEEQVEAYKMGGIEYAEGDISSPLGKNVDLRLSFKNGAGFDQSGVTELIFERQINGTTVQTISKKDTEFIKDFGSGTILFDGDGLTDANAAIVGTPNINKIVIYYKVGTATKVEIIKTGDIDIPQLDIDNIPNLSNVSETDIDPTIFSEGLSSRFVTNSFTYVNLKSKAPGFHKSVRVIQNDDDSVTFVIDKKDFELVSGIKKYNIEKYLDDQYVIKVSGGGSDGSFVIWDRDKSTTSVTSDSIFSSSTMLASATWTLDTVSRKRSKFIQSATYKCGGYGAVDVTSWFKSTVDNNDPGGDLSKYLCSSGGKYTDCANSGSFPGAHSAFADLGLYEAAKAAGSEGGSCGGTYHYVVITGINGYSTRWTWGSYLDMSNILSNQIAPSLYIQSATYKCGGYGAVDVTSWFKSTVDNNDPGGDLSKYLCSSGGKYTDCANSGSFPGAHSAFADLGLYEAAKAAGSEGGSCGGTYHYVVITGVNGATYTWSWGSYLDMSGIITGDPVRASDRIIINKIKALST